MDINDVRREWTPIVIAMDLGLGSLGNCQHSLLHPEDEPKSWGELFSILDIKVHRLLTQLVRIDPNVAKVRDGIIHCNCGSPYQLLDFAITPHFWRQPHLKIACRFTCVNDPKTLDIDVTLDEAWTSDHPVEVIYDN